MPFVEVFTREELSDAVRAELAETLLVTMMNIEIGHPTRRRSTSRTGRSVLRASPVAGSVHDHGVCGLVSVL